VLAHAVIQNARHGAESVRKLGVPMQIAAEDAQHFAVRRGLWAWMMKKPAVQRCIHYCHAPM
jgi:hypothetical protein